MCVIGLPAHEDSGFHASRIGIQDANSPLTCVNLNLLSHSSPAMSGYRGRAGPNFSEFLNNLNAVSPSYDQEQFNTDDINLDDELAMFTNTDFTHFDIPSIPDAGTANFDLDDNPTANDNIKYEDLLAATTPASVLIGTSPAEPVPLFPNYNTPIQPAPPANAFTVNPQPPSSVISSATSPRPSRRRNEKPTPHHPQPPPRSNPALLPKRTNVVVTLLPAHASASKRSSARRRSSARLKKLMTRTLNCNRRSTN